MAETLGALGVPVKLAIALDPMSDHAVTGRVERMMTLRVHYVRVAAGRNFQSNIVNIDLKNPAIGTSTSTRRRRSRA
jgi:hypothetical protein